MNNFLKYIEGKQTLIFADFEFTCGKGIPAEDTEIIQASVFTLSNPKGYFGVHLRGTSSEEMTRYVTPVIHPILTEYCTKLTGITDEVIKCSYPLSQNEAIRKIYNIAKSYGDDTKIFVFGNWDRDAIRFCEKRLNESSDVKEKVPPLHELIIDIQYNIAEANARAGMELKSLAYYANAYGIQIEKMHDAGSDTKILIELFKKIFQENVSLPNQILIDIIAEQSLRIHKLEKEIRNIKKQEKQTSFPINTTCTHTSSTPYGYIFAIDKDNKCFYKKTVTSKAENKAFYKLFKEKKVVFSFFKEKNTSKQYALKLSKKGYTCISNA